eukprot:6460551-Amphidinium_carterae.8
MATLPEAAKRRDRGHGLLSKRLKTLATDGMPGSTRPAKRRQCIPLHMVSLAWHATAWKCLAVQVIAGIMV